MLLAFHLDPIYVHLISCVVCHCAYSRWNYRGGRIPFLTRHHYPPLMQSQGTRPLLDLRGRLLLLPVVVVAMVGVVVAAAGRLIPVLVPPPGGSGRSATRVPRLLPPRSPSLLILIPHHLIPVPPPVISLNRFTPDHADPCNVNAG